MRLRLLDGKEFGVYWVDTGDADRDALPWLQRLALSNMREHARVMATVERLTEWLPTRTVYGFKFLDDGIWETPTGNVKPRLFFFIDPKSPVERFEKIVICTTGLLKQTDRDRNQDLCIKRSIALRREYFAEKIKGNEFFNE